MQDEISEETRERVEELVSCGLYGSGRDVFDEAVRLLVQKHSSLLGDVDALLDEGIGDIEAGRYVPLSDELFEDVTRRGRERFAAKKGDVA